MEIRRDFPPGFRNPAPFSVSSGFPCFSPKEIRRDFPPGFRNSAPLTAPKLTFVKVDLPTSPSPRISTHISGKKRPGPEMEENRASQKWRRQVSATKTKPNEQQQQTLKKKKPPIPPSRTATETINGGRGGGERECVLAKLHLFRSRCKELSRMSTDERGTRRVDFLAMQGLKREGKIRIPDRVLGSIPGVEVGDRFEYRVELIIVGLHCLTQNGIDCKEHQGQVLATCVVATEGYPDKMSDSDELTYTGEGGLYGASRKEGHGLNDQELKRGNLALKNSMEAKTDVRVVRGLKLHSKIGDPRTGKITYVYDGLYRVTSFGDKKGPQKNRVFEFKLKRLPGQPAVAWHRFK